MVGSPHELASTIPPSLVETYTLLEYIGSGGEAVVYLVEPRAHPGHRLALKVYRPGHDINRELLDRLRARPTDSPYIPAIHDYGYARSPWGEDLAWEAQEYFPHGSLRQILDGAPLAEEQARDTVAAVAACLRYWQEQLQFNHTDVKPENLLVRQVAPPVFALTDFGGAVRATLSRVYGGLAVTEDYAAPEVVEGRREAPSAWWSLGIMVHELATGRRPERGDSWLAARSREIDVSAIGAEEWRLLARGLLHPSPEARWGYQQVNQWLAGEQPEVRPQRRYATLSFGDVAHQDPPSLAFDLLDRSEAGAVWLRTNWRQLRSWLDREVNDHIFDREYLTQLESHPERAHLAICALAARFVPGMPPRYRGHEITAEGLGSLATGDPSQRAVLREALELGAVGVAARHWCDHPACRASGTNRCRQLERAQHEVPLIMERVRDSVRQVADTAPTQPGTAEWDSAWAQATQLVLDPEATQRYRRLLRTSTWNPLRSDTPRHASWWREQRRSGLRGTDGEVSAQAALVTAFLMLPAASTAGARSRELQRVERRHRWRERWQRTRAAVAGAIPRSSGSPAPAAEGNAPGDQQIPNRPDERQRAVQQRRTERRMRQVQRAMSAGRCRRHGIPLAFLGLLDGVGTLLWTTVGLYSTSAGIATAQRVATGFVDSPVGGLLSAVGGTAMGLLPAEIGYRWWFPIVLAVLLWLACRTAAASTRPARLRLAASWLAVLGSVVMTLRLLASALLMLTMGVLIPLSLLVG
ncbi:protein kinase [Lipingzhangella sp. LS1_29]|uniref:Protein kinase n=1 Tax=Lipingzhangella rawalii TaxID=2055835 RepID=A0ABU2H2A5_9ACTN|nr:protein kinase [Lipingzhangella rawalii]MDS1269423.1 protein kinase [Lipingzhangella rawalii]